MRFANLPLPLLKFGALTARSFNGSLALGLARDFRDAARLHEADVALVSFPKSGRTFIRVMMARLYQSRYGHPETDLLEFSRLRRTDQSIPRLLFTHDGDAMRTAAQIGADKRAYRRSKVALVARHPADVAVSRYHHLKHRSQDEARKRLADQPLGSFIWTEQGGIPAMVAFLNGWANARGTVRDFSLFRFEDFRNAPHATLAGLARFVGLECDEPEIADAVEFARFENLREREREGYFSSVRLGVAKPGEKNSAKVRSGKVGGYRSQFDAAECARIDAYVAEHLDPFFGYGSSAALTPASSIAASS